MNGTFEPENTTKELHPGWISLQCLVDWFDCCFANYEPLPDYRAPKGWEYHPGFPQQQVNPKSPRQARKEYLDNPNNESRYAPRLFIAVATAEFLGERHRQVEEFHGRQLVRTQTLLNTAQREASRLRDERNSAVGMIVLVAHHLNKHPKVAGARDLLETLRQHYGSVAGFPTKK